MSNVELLLTVTQIEQKYGYARGSVTSLRAKGQMPEPDQQYGRTPLWRESTIAAWLHNRREAI